MNTVFIDIESIPGQANWVIEHISENIKPPGSYKKPESIAKWHEEQGPAAIDEKWRHTALDATMGEICVISWAHDDGQIHSVSREPAESEAVLLMGFYQQLIDTLPPTYIDGRKWDGKPQLRFCGHNVPFDLGFIWRRSIINEVRPSVAIPYNAKPWSEDIIDTCQMWKGSSRDSASMDVLLKALGIAYGDDIHGSQVWDEIKAGNLSKVRTHCELDVDRTRQIYNRITA